ncbi:MAG: hypothetical protein WD225_08850 [Ilumatobacteraceae bacterium]
MRVQRQVRRRPGIARMLWRGAFRRCPWCGDRRAFFTGWFTKRDDCRRCGTPWRRGYEGFELGALAINTIVTLGLIVVGATVAMVATAPDFAVVPIVVGLMIGAAIVPVVLYPVSYTLWQAIDLAMRSPDPEEVARWSVRALMVDAHVDGAHVDVEQDGAHDDGGKASRDG